MPPRRVGGDERAKDLGKCIKAAREAAGLSWRELAAKLGVHRQTIAGWEKGSRAPAILTFLDLSRILGVDPGDLLRSLPVVAPLEVPPQEKRGRKPKRKEGEVP